MEVNVEDVSSVKKVLHIEIPEETVGRELDKAYQDLKKTAKIKGFRPGKTPRTVLERMFRKDVHADVSSKLIQDSLFEVIKQKELKLVGYPQIDPPQLETQKPYSYQVSIEVSPEIRELAFRDFSLKKTVWQPSETEIDSQLKMLQKNLASQITVAESRPVQAEDFAVIDFEGFKDGQPFEETRKTENFVLKIGSGNILKEFEEKLIGQQPGEQREFAVTFPADYFNPKLANLEITFRVDLKEIREEQLPAIDDAMAAKLGKYASLDELKADIHKNLEEGYARRTDQELQEQVFEQLIALQEFEVPEALVAYELEHILADAERTFARHNTSLEQLGLTREGLTEKYRDVAVKQAKRHLLLGKIIQQEKLTLSDQDIEAGLQDMARAFNQPVDGIRSFYDQNKDKLEAFKETLLEKNALKLIIDSGRIEEVQPTAEEDTAAEQSGT